MPASVGNRIVGNLVGTTLSGDTALGNGTERYLGDGIRIEGGRFNVIGGSTAGRARTSSPATSTTASTSATGRAATRSSATTIGTDLTGTRPLGNGVDGVFLQDASHNLVGSLISGDANVIGGNGYNGVFLYGDSHDNLIAGNFIGTNARLDRGLGNGTVASFADGIFLAQFGTPKGPSRNTILGNTLAYNRDGAISIDVDTDANSSRQPPPAELDLRQRRAGDRPGVRRRHAQRRRRRRHRPQPPAELPRAPEPGRGRRRHRRRHGDPQ